jgi:aryl-alcohol dehydrogenase-like predicted oxidoreductase
MPLSIEDHPSHEQGIETIHAALDAGCRNIDTAWAYYESGGQEETNENLVREALASWKGPREEVLVATKVGHFRNFTDGAPTWGLDGRPEVLMEHAKQSAKALGVEAIDLLYFHRPDPKVPYEESLGGMKEILDAGIAKKIGLSNASVEQIDLGVKYFGDDFIAVQNEYSPLYRSTEDTLEHTAKLGISFVAYSPLGGAGTAADASKFAKFKEIGDAHGVSFQQVILAWELAKGDHMIVIPGSRRPETILDSLKAGDLQLSSQELASLD